MLASQGFKRYFAHAKGYGENMATKIDLEVKRIVDDCYAQASDIIRQNMDVLHRSAQLLLEKIGSKENYSKRIILSTELIERESVGYKKD